MVNLFHFTPRPPTPDSAFTRASPIPPTPSQIREESSRYRVTFTSHLALAKGYPSTGGVLVKKVNAVDLIYLGLSRREQTLRSSATGTSEDKAEEDAWCAKLRKLGPTWYRCLKDWDDAENGVRPKTQSEDEEIFIGYEPDSNSGSNSGSNTDQNASHPTGGIWVLQYKQRLRPSIWGKYELCLDMRERCSVMEEFGAVRFAGREEVERLNRGREERARRERIELEVFGEFN